jgi:2,3-dihydroxybenzoate decarboxylase
MADRIALEEHFICDCLLPYLEADMPHVSGDARARLLADLSDLGERRLAAMAAAGVSRAVLSISGPGVQAEPDAAKATRLAREANDVLAAAVQRRPDAYSGFAHLAVQDPAGAADELERCVRDLGFVGAMVNGHTNGVYLDDPRHDPLFERLEALDRPLYLHPTNAFRLPHVLEGCPELRQPVWEWTTETASHFLRLVYAGVFDRFPKLKIVLGHMGETLPFMLWRLDSRTKFLADKRPLALPPSAYLKRNLFVTTAGQCSDVPLAAALSALGADHVMFSVDYPYEDSAEAGRFLDTAAVDEETRAKIGRGSASALLGLPG